MLNLGNRSLLGSRHNFLCSGAYNFICSLQWNTWYPSYAILSYHKENIKLSQFHCLWTIFVLFPSSLVIYQPWIDHHTPPKKIKTKKGKPQKKETTKQTKESIYLFNFDPEMFNVIHFPTIFASQVLLCWDQFRKKIIIITNKQERQYVKRFQRN